MGLLVFILLLAGIDIGIKNQIDAAAGEDFPKASPIKRMKIYKRRNKGFPFGILENHPEAVKILPAAVTGFLAGSLFAGGKKKKGTRIALVLLIAGGLSNVFDRMKRGYVVDYLHLDFSPIKKIIFNLADMYIFVGAVIYAVLGKERS
ncbi:MAG: signal peptidase II [Johnsonella sp.]|nr:signal peptidase II [Johnsonella sp.]